MKRRAPAPAHAVALALALAAAPSAAQHHDGDAARADQTAGADAADAADAGADFAPAEHRAHGVGAKANGARAAPLPGDVASPFPAPAPAEHAAAFPPGLEGMDMASHMHDDPMVAVLRGDRLERGNDGALGWDLQAGAGRAFDKLWLRHEGERRDGRLRHATTELAWHHATGPWWDRTLGVRHDARPGGVDRQWLALGVQGLAPYKIELQATAYIGPEGRIAGRFEAEYDVLLGNRLVLQPQLQANLYGRDDPANGLGSGLSDAEFGLRLRYEFSPRFTPYVGYVWARRFGATADHAGAGGEPAEERHWVLGLRFWL